MSGTLLAMLALSQLPGLEIPLPYWVFGLLCPAFISAPVSLALVRQANAIRDANVRLVAAQAQLQHRADHDDLTGALNRAAFFREAALVSATRGTGCVPLVDIDHFKQVNDQHGHIVGDIALELVARTLAASLRDWDLIGRIGGEEFAILLPGLTPQLGVVLAERARTAVEQLRCVGTGGQLVPISISVGLAALTPGISINAALGVADRAMYRAKTYGRNRVIAAA